MNPDSDSDPAISSLTLNTPTKNKIKKRFFSADYFLKVPTFTSFFKDKKSKRGHKTAGIKFFLTIFAG
jgi:hypothetical protein